MKGDICIKFERKRSTARERLTSHFGRGIRVGTSINQQSHTISATILGGLNQRRETTLLVGFAAAHNANGQKNRRETFDKIHVEIGVTAKVNE